MSTAVHTEYQRPVREYYVHKAAPWGLNGWEVTRDVIARTIDYGEPYHGQLSLSIARRDHTDYDYDYQFVPAGISLPAGL